MPPFLCVIHELILRKHYSLMSSPFQTPPAGVINSVNGAGETALMYMLRVVEDDVHSTDVHALQTIEQALQLGADVAKTNKCGWNILHYAAAYVMNVKTLRYVVEMDRVDFDARTSTKYGYTPFLMACEAKNSTAILLFASKVANCLRQRANADRLTVRQIMDMAHENQTRGHSR